MTDEPAHRDAQADLNPLQQLIARRRRERGMSYAEIAAKGAMSRSTVYYLARANPLQRSPSATTLMSLARGLDLPVEIVRQAAADALGLHLATEHTRDRGLQVLMASVEKLSPDQRRHVAALVDSMLSRESAN